MLVAELKVSMNTVKVKQLLCLTRGTVGAEVLFSFGPEWNGLSRTAIFRTNMDTRDVVNVQEGLPVEIPWEVLDRISDDLMVGVYGFDTSHTVTITTAWASLGRIYPSARPSDQPSQPPSPGWTEQIQSQVSRAMQASREAVDAADSLSQEEGNRARAELQRRSAESERCSSERLRCEAEKQRVESSRQREQEQADWVQFNQQAQSDEAGRTDAEVLRADREEIRITAEQAREKSERDREKSEEGRTAGESGRVSGESGRISAERQRETAEEQRIAEEQLRRSEETGRQLREKSREEAEARRREAEKNRKNFIEDKKIGSQAGWSSENIVETLCPVFQKSAPIVTCYPVIRYPLEVISRIEPVQSGTGVPGPDNIRPVQARSQASMVHCGENLWSADLSFRGTDMVAYDAPGQKYTLQEGTGSYHVPVARLIRAIPAGTQITLRIFPESGYLKGGAEVFVGLSSHENPGKTDYMVRLEENVTLKNMVMSKTVTLKEPVDELSIVCRNAGMIWRSPVFRVGLSISGGMEHYVPYIGKMRTVQFPVPVFGGMFNWKTGVLTVDREFFTLPPDGYWSDQIGNGQSLGLDLARYGYGYSGDVLCENWEISYKVEDITNRNNFVMAKSGTLYVPFSTREEVRKVLTEHPVRLLLRRKQPVQYQLAPEAVCAYSGVNTLYSDTEQTLVNSREDLPHAFGSLQKQILELQNHVIGGV